MVLAPNDRPASGHIRWKRLPHQPTSCSLEPRLESDSAKCRECHAEKRAVPVSIRKAEYVALGMSIMSIKLIRLNGNELSGGSLFVSAPR